MGPRIIPSDEDGPHGVFLHEDLQQLSDLLAALVPLEEDNGFPGVLVDGSDAVVLGRLRWCRDHYLLSLGAPHGPQRGEPTEIELISIIEHISCVQPLTGVFNRLFFTA